MIICNNNIIENNSYLFENKTIALIGNAQSLFEKNLGAFIDQHDVVCRMNFGVNIIDPEQQGTKTDVWLMHHSFIPRQFQIRYPKLNFPSSKKFCFKLIHPIENTKHMYQQYNIPDVEFIDEKILAQNFAGYKEIKIPSTGLLSVCFINIFKFAELNIFGFDWKRTKTWYNDQEEDEKNSTHNWQAEQRLFCEKVLLKENVTIY